LLASRCASWRRHGRSAGSSPTRSLRSGFPWNESDHQPDSGAGLRRGPYCLLSGLGREPGSPFAAQPSGPR
jgi:hypothetical protein